MEFLQIRNNATPGDPARGSYASTLFLQKKLRNWFGTKRRETGTEFLQMGRSAATSKALPQVSSLFGTQPP